MSDSDDIQNAGRELKLDDHSHGRRALPAAAIITATFLGSQGGLRAFRTEVKEGKGSDHREHGDDPEVSLCSL